ncbi:MAG TPA: M20/M25/M40 family metallo-hydrolase [Thermoanaerobaculia bacterium]|nr:M20/M25/M40 family metallo-hydrolase [Thermoanaerobaculia bacterium]
MAEQAGTKGAVKSGEPQGSGGLIAGLVLLGLALLLAITQGGPSAPKGTDAPVAEFSAGRAGEVLRGLLGDGTPHPLGSAANAQVRERVMAQLRALGYAPEVQEGSTCQAGWGCAKVWNVLARLPGRQAGKAVLLVSHYDSVPAGPGASDDMTGVAAVLEVARALKAGPPPRNTVLFLIDDGEEEGLLGAKAFADSSPTADEVGVVVNLEARGTSGPSLMFQTSPDDAWLLDAWAPRASRPFTSSVFSTIYRFMPNDTDLTVFLNRGVPGMNFAFIENPSQYHTPLDNLADATPGSLQHHGDNALAAVRGLAEADLAHPPRGSAVYFDLLHLTVVRWSSGLSPVLGLLALVLLLVAAVRARRRGLATWGAVALGAVAPLLAFLLSLVVTFGLQTLLASAFPSQWVAHPLPAMLAFWLLPLAVTVALGGALGRRFGGAGLWAGTWIGWSLLGILLGVTLPGFSYLFLPPALVAGVLGIIFATGGSAGGRLAASVVPALVVGLLWFPILGSLYLGLGLLGLLATSILLSFVYSSLIPLAGQAGALGRRWLPLAAAAAGVIGAVIAMVSPPSSPQVPRNVVIQLHQDAVTGTSRWVVFGAPPLPPSLRQAAAFAPKPEVPYPWLPPQAMAFVAPAPRLEASGPELAVEQDSVVEGKRQVRLRLTSPRGAQVGMFAIPAEAQLDSIKIDGHAFPTNVGRGPLNRAKGWKLFSNLTLSPGGSEIEVVLGSTQPADWYAIDRSYGLPPTAAALLAARPKDVITIQDGDTVIMTRKVKI